MNDDRSELAGLRNELARIESEVRFLRLRADQIEARLVRETVIPIAAPLPPIIPPEPEPVIATNTPPVFEPEPEVKFEPAPEPPEEPALSQPIPEPKKSWELQLGAYWFVRIGIVMLLTAMVFLGNYAYQHYIPRLGAFGKVILLYTVSFGLLAAGTILPRRRASLKNYGQVLFAGGLAAVYFTTYAAHHFENLRIITSPVLDGLLLLAWTSFIVWLADRKKLEILAVFAIGLSYYAALITNVGSFTLVSNFLLAAAAVFFLVRNRWLQLSFISLAASYGTYFYWRYYAGVAAGDLDLGRWPIAGYWLIFTTAVFLTKHDTFPGPRRASFLSFNNGAAFALLTASFVGHGSSYWKLCLLAGSLLLGLAAAARVWITQDELARRAYLAQGIFLVTLGFITKLSGPTLALVLAVESCLLLVFSTQWNNRLLRFASIIVAMLAFAWMILPRPGATTLIWWPSFFFLALLAFNSAWSIKRVPTENEPLHQLGSYYLGLGLLSWTISIFKLAPTEMIAPILGATCLAFTASLYILRLREFVFLALPLALIAQIHSLLSVTASASISWSHLLIIALSILQALWWKRQQILETPPTLRQSVEIIASLAAALITYAWASQRLEANSWIAAAAGLTLVWTILGGALRSGPLVASGQIFLVGTFATTLTRFANNQEPPWIYLATLILVFISLAAAARLIKLPDQSARAATAVGDIYQWLAAILVLASINNYVPVETRFLALTLFFVASAIPAHRGATYTFAPGAALALIGLGFWFIHPRAHLAEAQTLLAFALLAGTQIGLRKNSGRLQLPEIAHTLWIGLIAAAFWLFISRLAIERSQGSYFYLTASWAIFALALFALGLGLREKTYRWAGLIILTAALGRAVLLDVWKLATIYRILSFLALSITLLLLGYVYNRYQENFKKWL